MNTIKCIKSRRSIRKYLPKKVAHDLIEELIACAKWAPSWNNCKAVRYTVVDQSVHLKKLADTLVASENVHIVKNAPVIFIISNVKKRSGYERNGHTSSAKGDSWEMFDAGVACQTLCLAATELGLGTVIMGTFDEAGIAKFANLPDEEEIIALIACGYADEKPKAPKRKEVSEILRYLP